MTIRFQSFEPAINYARDVLRSAPLVHSLRWQGVRVIDKPEMATYETLHYSFLVPMSAGFDLQSYRDEIKPNLPWADNHFELERVSGEPINPGTTWKEWPYGLNAQKFLEDFGHGPQYNHSYAERYWPKYAGLTEGGRIDQTIGAKFIKDASLQRRGIRYDYGDLLDVCKLLAEDPLTRQAYLPIFFPEDTGGGAKRAPCTLGYQFIMRRNKLDVVYWIRSCDFVRHFRDDIYLTIRLALWVIEQARALSSEYGTEELWKQVQPGDYLMHITSLHLFKNDYVSIFGAPRP